MRVHLFLEDVHSVGTETAINFFESGCVERTRQTITGQAMVQESERLGEVVREADLVSVGDHLVSFTSDTECRYTLKVDVEAKRQ